MHTPWSVPLFSCDAMTQHFMRNVMFSVTYFVYILITTGVFLNPIGSFHFMYRHFLSKLNYVKEVLVHLIDRSPECLLSFYEYVYVAHVLTTSPTVSCFFSLSQFSLIHSRKLSGGSPTTSPQGPSSTSPSLQTGFTSQDDVKDTAFRQ